MYRLVQKYYPDGGTALNLDMVFQKCIDAAERLYGTRINLKKNANRILIDAEPEAVIPQIIQILDAMCFEGGELKVVINADQKHRSVIVSFECSGICDGIFLEFELYPGIPSVVISDKDTEAELERIISLTFEMVAVIRKHRESAGKSHG